MNVLLDNIAAVVIGGTILLIIAFLQVRGQASALDGIAYYATKARTVDFVQQLRTDLNNVGAGVPGADIEAGKALLHHATAAGGDTTDVFTFRTYGDSTAFETKTGASIVCYKREPTGRTARVFDPASGTTVGRPTFRIVRRLNPTTPATCTGGTETASSASSFTAFRLSLHRDDGSAVTTSAGFPQVRKIEAHLRAASPLGGRAGDAPAPDGSHTGQVEETRWTGVFHPVNLTRKAL